jgi:hypothetical protein
MEKAITVLDRIARCASNFESSFHPVEPGANPGQFRDCNVSHHPANFLDNVPRWNPLDGVILVVSAGI